MSKKVNAIVISASSDIAGAICKDWSARGWNVYGTYRSPSPLVEELTRDSNTRLVQCDLLDVKSVDTACVTLASLCPQWDVLLIAPARQEPVGDFHEVNFDEWEEGVQLNLLRQLRILHKLLPHRNLKTSLPEPCVLFFAGGGTNNAVVHYSSYTLSKIALIKMMELLDAELPDTRFVIVGPGWVKTKGHLPTLRMGAKHAGANYQKTLDKLNSNECTPMDQVVSCCNWLATTPCKAVKGRNFSVVFDKWGSSELEQALETDPNMYKLRRHKNLWSSSSLIESMNRSNTFQ